MNSWMLVYQDNWVLASETIEGSNVRVTSVVC